MRLDWPFVVWDFGFHDGDVPPKNTGGIECGGRNIVTNRVRNELHSPLALAQSEVPVAFLVSVTAHRSQAGEGWGTQQRSDLIIGMCSL
jgi:hypothetical protein